MIYYYYYYYYYHHHHLRQEDLLLSCQTILTVGNVDIHWAVGSVALVEGSDVLRVRTFAPAAMAVSP